MDGPLSDSDKMKIMRAKGLSLAKIAAAYGISTTTVLYRTDPEWAARHREKNNAQQRVRYHAKKRKAEALMPTVPDYDDSEPVWIESRSVDPGLVCRARQSRRPQPEPVKQHAVTRAMAIDAYLDGDRDALSRWLAAH